MLPNIAAMSLRNRQIDTLKIFNENVTEIKQNEDYAVGFLSDGRQFQLDVHLGTNFPSEKPRISISPRVHHDWVNEQSGEIHKAPGLVNFTVHSDLGRVVQAIIREYEKFPPPLITDSVHHNASPTTQSQTPPASTIQSSIRELCDLTIDDLIRLNSDPAYLDDFVEEMGAMKNLNSDLNVLMADVGSIANENLSKEAQMLQQRQNVTAHLANFVQLGEQYESLNRRYQKKSEEFAPQHIKELLQIEASNADGICDTHVEEFLNGSVDVQAFLDQYLQAKKLSAMRKAKEERLAHQLREFERAGL